MRQVNGVRGGYEVGKKGCEAGTRQVKGVRGRYKAGERSARPLQGR